ncbi:MAG: glutathione S-transferase family protein [Alphaproteobacteria bacterium]|nr:glutathione S-transferase family protein [Alphaproteobacteria bacterium]
MSEPVLLSGAPGSPYTRKMLAVLRYRRVPYRFLLAGHGGRAGLPRPKVDLLPTFYFPSGSGAHEAVVDSTPIIRRLEAMQAGRAVVPPDPALAFLDALLEDYADEWLTKAMFHYRWAYADDIEKAGAILPLWRDTQLPDAEWHAARKAFSERQIGRLYVVGSNPATGPVIEASYRRFLAIFEAHLKAHPFLMGGRPGASDFAAFGQLTQLSHFDPTPTALTLKEAPRVYAWVDAVEDLSGHEAPEDGWARADALPATLRELLREMARSYVPVMLANARALNAGADTVTAEVDGTPWTQQPFPYQGKCVAWLRQDFAALAGEARRVVGDLLEATGCLPLITAPV